ncbi:MAG: Co2+/Mg2+ efflux protein ApaG [Myxococcota bacterium]|nr:Co2+/Mg2+ efflux protein ApaG [Myxococcota bacterium]
MSQATTQGIHVEVQSAYVAARSQPQARRWLFVYRVEIRNDGEQPAQLISRYWRIQDGMGEVQEVEGPGVIGEKPRLEPGQSHVYTSFCPLTTSMGKMEGHYVMQRDDGSRFNAEIAPFLLVDPASIN